MMTERISLNPKYIFCFLKSFEFPVRLFSLLEIEVIETVSLCFVPVVPFIKTEYNYPIWKLTQNQDDRKKKDRITLAIIHISSLMVKKCFIL